MLAGKVAEWSKALVLGFNSSHQSERAWVRIPPLSIFLFFFFLSFFLLSLEGLLLLFMLFIIGRAH